jgi:hypothetical protein
MNHDNEYLLELLIFTDNYLITPLDEIFNRFFSHLHVSRERELEKWLVKCILDFLETRDLEYLPIIIGVLFQSKCNFSLFFLGYYRYTWTPTISWFWLWLERAYGFAIASFRSVFIWGFVMLLLVIPVPFGHPNGGVMFSLMKRTNSSLRFRAFRNDNQHERPPPWAVFHF